MPFFQIISLARGLARVFILSLFAVLAAAPAAFCQVRDDGSKMTQRFSTDQHTLERTYTNAAGAVTEKIVYSLDERNLSVGARHFDGKGVVRYAEIYRWDTADHVTQIEFADGAGKSMGRRVFTFRGDTIVACDDYDAAGNFISRGRLRPLPLVWLLSTRT